MPEIKSQADLLKLPTDIRLFVERVIKENTERRLQVKAELIANGQFKPLILYLVKKGWTLTEICRAYITTNDEIRRICGEIKWP